LTENKYGDDYWSIDKRMERAAKPEHFSKLPFSDFRLNLIDCERLNKGLILLREREELAAKGFSVAEHLGHCDPEECGVCLDMKEMAELGAKVTA
jgi:hypothetical protein